MPPKNAKNKRETAEFQRAVWRACRRIPKGRVTTYGEIAKALRKPRASRAVGNALNASPGMPTVPCHRVVRANGEVGGYARGTRAKRALLERERVRVRRGRVVDFEKKFLRLRKRGGCLK